MQWVLLRDGVDSVDTRLLRPRDRCRDPRRGDPELACRLGEGEPELGHRGGPCATGYFLSRTPYALPVDSPSFLFKLA